METIYVWDSWHISYGLFAFKLMLLVTYCSAQCYIHLPNISWSKCAVFLCLMARAFSNIDIINCHGSILINEPEVHGDQLFDKQICHIATLLRWAPPGHVLQNGNEMFTFRVNFPTKSPFQFFIIWVNENIQTLLGMAVRHFFPMPISAYIRILAHICANICCWRIFPHLHGHPYTLLHPTLPSPSYFWVSKII